MLRYVILHLQKLFRKRKVIFFAIFFGIFFLAVFSIKLHNENNSLEKTAQNYVVMILSPIEMGISNIKKFCSNQGDEFKNLIQAKKENEKLKEKIITLQDSFLKAKILEQENLDLKKKLQYIASKEIKFKTAKLIAGVYNTSLREAFINAGSKDGIKENCLIFNQDGAIGRVISVNQDNSKVMLLNDSRSYIPAKAISNGNKMIVSGSDGDLLEVKFIAENKSIDIGEVLLTSSEANLVPDNIPIGKIVKADGENYKIKPFANLNNFDIVYIYLHE
jgi:rod shape-determining protein MreC